MHACMHKHSPHKVGVLQALEPVSLPGQSSLRAAHTRTPSFTLLMDHYLTGLVAESFHLQDNRQISSHAVTATCPP